MIMYGTRYVLQFDSEKFGHEYKILIKEDGYSGSPEKKSLGTAPLLRKDDSDSGISERHWKWLSKRTRTGS